MSALTARRTTGPATGSDLDPAQLGHASPAPGRPAARMPLNARRFPSTRRSAGVASRSHRSHCTLWSSVSASAASATRSSRS